MQTRWTQLVAVVFGLSLLLVSTPSHSGAATVFQIDQQRTSDFSGLGIPMSPDELQALVAPIALYPDPLVGQVLAGATYPDQIVAAEDFVAHKGLAGHALMEAVALQPWDPSVKALTEFPVVLNTMAANLAWTSQLGESYHDQQTELMSTIQGLRAKAMAAGNLKSGPQLRVNQPTPDIVALQPANPQVLYLPLYNPALVYGIKLQTPGYSSPNTPADAAVSFGEGVAAGALTSGGCCDWGSSSWNCNWYHGVAYFHDYPYNGNNAWHGSYYGGYNYYGNHTYHTHYDYNHPYTAFQGAASHGSQTTASDIAPDERGSAKVDSFDISSGGWLSTAELRGWGPGSTGGMTTVFSSWADHANSSSFANVGWGDRVASYRGWLFHTAGGGGGWGRGGRLEGAH